MVGPTKINNGHNRFWDQKKLIQKMCVQINWGPHEFEYKKVLGPTKFGSTKNDGFTKMFGLQKDWVL